MRTNGSNLLRDLQASLKREFCLLVSGLPVWTRRLRAGLPACGNEQRCNEPCRIDGRECGDSSRLRPHSRT